MSSLSLYQKGPSKRRASFPPSPYPLPLSRLLEEAGAHEFGVVAVDELAQQGAVGAGRPADRGKLAPELGGDLGRMT